jgi:hypothetical protein
MAGLVRAVATWCPVGSEGLRRASHKVTFVRAVQPLQAQADEFHKLDEMLIRHTVEPVQHNIGHPREQLNERDAGSPGYDGPFRA